MTLSELIEASHVAYKGNVRFPAAGSDKYTMYVSIANRKQREWANDAYVDWSSLYSDESIGTVSTSSLEYDLPSEVIRAASFIYLEKDGTMNPYSLLKPRDALKDTRDRYSAYISGTTLHFTDAITDRFDGASLIVPAYYMPDPLVNANDEVAVDNPDWLVYALAAELARSDYSKDDQFGNLVGMANDIYDKMKTANEDFAAEQSATVPFGNETMGM